MEPNLLVDLVNVRTPPRGEVAGIRTSGPPRFGQELRRDPRVPVRQMILGLPTGARAVVGNVSISGVGFEIDDAGDLRLGDMFSVQLTVPDSHGPLDMRAELRHLQYLESAGRYYGGARFVEFDELSEYPLFRFVEEASLAMLANAVVQ